MSQLQLEADLTFSVTLDGEEMHGTLRASGSELELTVSDPHLLGGTGTTPARALAEELAARGIRLSITADRPLVTLGVHQASFVQRRITGSPHIKVASVGAAFRLLRLRRTAAESAPLTPPPSPLPLLPTFLRRRRVPTTTHDPDRGGYPRLVRAPDPDGLGFEVRQEVCHLGGRTTIGSSAEADLVVPGLEFAHAEIHHTAGDEFVLLSLVRSSAVRVNGAVVTEPALLRTGTRVELGDQVWSFAREEYADHGRPFGGRIGGELGRQEEQPRREELQR